MFNPELQIRALNKLKMKNNSIKLLQKELNKLLKIYFKYLK